MWTNTNYELAEISDALNIEKKVVRSVKAVLLSIKPKYCGLIASGKKAVEVRKTRPKLDTPFKVYIYETKTPLRWNKAHNNIIGGQGGYVIGEFVCDVIYELHDWHLDPRGIYQEIEEENLKKLLKMSQLTYDELCLYRNGMPYYKPLFAWHITNLVIYDKPKELSEFEKPHEYIDLSYRRKNSLFKVITRPPQSWCYVESDVQEDEDTKVY